MSQRLLAAAANSDSSASGLLCHARKNALLGPRVGWTVGLPCRRIDFHCGLDRPFGLRIPGADRLLIRATLQMRRRGCSKLGRLCSAALPQNNSVDSHIWAELLCIIFIVVFEPAPLKRGHK